MPPPEIIAVMDLEWTAWEGSKQRRWSGPGEEMEIVQIGAVKLLNDGALPETEALDILVKPRVNPDLSDYFVDLTGITQAELDAGGVGFAEALDALREFLGTDTRAVYSYGADYTIIQRNCGLTGVAFPFEDALFVNVRDLFTALGPEFASIDSSGLPAVMGFPPPGASHRAVDDCRCIAEAMRILRKRGEF